MSTLNWFDNMAGMEEAETTRVLRMTAEEWKEEGKRLILAQRGKGDLRPVLNFLMAMDELRAAARPTQTTALRVRTEFDRDFAIWRDMIDEPAKYGDDICDWLALNETLMAGPGRWRLGAYWCEKQAEQDAADANARIYDAAVLIQAAVRGHMARNAQPFRDCCMCLSHRICPLKTDVGMMCRGCAEQGPYTEETGPLADPWSEFRGDYEDMAAPEPEPEHCRWCMSTLEDGQKDLFCDRDCEYDYMKETWRDRRY